jgi:hypothetical protein
VVAAASSEWVLVFVVRQEAADVGQIGGRKSAAAAEGVDWRRRRRGKVWATTRCGFVCGAWCMVGGDSLQGKGKAMQCNAALGVGYVESY